LTRIFYSPQLNYIGGRITVNSSALNTYQEGTKMTNSTPRANTMPARLMPPTDRAYLMIAATVDRRLPFLPVSRRKKALLSALSEDIAELALLPGVTRADVFDSQLVAPGMGHELLRARSVAPARFDIVVLVETVDISSAQSVRGVDVYRRMAERLTAAATSTYEMAARNVRRIADVDHDKPSVFLFNFFYADDTERLISVWENTAGWFVEKTALPDSTVLEPLPGEPQMYGIVNHASWPHFRTFLPHLILRPSFRRFVLATFAANGVAAQPILYRRVQPAKVGAPAV
jgi:hypothetical protein